MAAAVEIMQERLMGENTQDGRHHPKLADGFAEADAALEAWARWARSALAGLSWPAVTLIGRVMDFGVTVTASRGGSAHPVEVDELCELVERAIMRLREVERRVVVMHYLNWQPMETAARRCHMSSGRFRTLLHRARRSVADYLNGAREKIALQQKGR
jgi:predicted DNA-binding protein (UPF0251 family)